MQEKLSPCNFRVYKATRLRKGGKVQGPPADQTGSFNTAIAWLSSLLKKLPGATPRKHAKLGASCVRRMVAKQPLMTAKSARSPGTAPCRKILEKEKLDD